MCRLYIHVQCHVSIDAQCWHIVTGDIFMLISPGITLTMSTEPQGVRPVSGCEYLMMRFFMMRMLILGATTLCYPVHEAKTNNVCF